MVCTTSRSAVAVRANGTSGITVGVPASRRGDGGDHEEQAPPRRGDDRLGERRRQGAVTAGSFLGDGEQIPPADPWRADGEHRRELLRSGLVGLQREPDHDQPVGRGPSAGCRAGRCLVAPMAPDDSTLILEQRLTDQAGQLLGIEDALRSQLARLAGGGGERAGPLEASLTVHNGADPLLAPPSPPGCPGPRRSRAVDRDHPRSLRLPLQPIIRSQTDGSPQGPVRGWTGRRFRPNSSKLRADTPLTGSRPRIRAQTGAQLWSTAARSTGRAAM